LDKWLWAARFFKTRTQAAAAILNGRVQLNHQRTKPGKTVALGDVIHIAKDELGWTVVVRATTTRRGPATAAAELYEESVESHAARQEMVRQRREHATIAAIKGWRGTGRPSKRDRRRMERFKRSSDDA
jgi:ribosome-associated heat shock protein Hsp15